MPSTTLPQKRTEIIVGQVRSQLILVHVHCQKRLLILLNSDKNLEAKSLTLPYMLELRLHSSHMVCMVAACTAPAV